MEEKTILIEKTAKKFKLRELACLGGLFVFLLAGLGLMYWKMPVAITSWVLAGVFLIAWVVVKIQAWYHHG